MIRWKPAQQMLVAEKSYMILTDPMYSGSQIEAVRMAMHQVLPSDLHRDLKGMQEVKWIRDAWAQLEKSGFKPSSVIQPVSNHQIEHEIRESVKTTALSDLSLHDLMLEVARRMQELTDPKHLLKIVRDEVNATIDARMPGMIPADPRVEIDDTPVDIAPDPTKHRVLILGLQPDQKEIMKAKYKNLLDLHFMDGSEGTNRIKNTVGVMDYTIRTRWCKGHLGSTKDWPNFTIVTTGMSTIQRMINEKFRINV